MKIIENIGKEYYKLGATPANLSGPVSKSMLWEFNQSPHKWLHGRRKESTPAMEFGTLVHTVVLQPHLLQQEYAISPHDSFRTNAAKEWREEQVAAGKIVVTEDDMDRAAEIDNTIKEDSVLFSLGEYERELAIFGSVGDIQAKCLIDIAPSHGDCLVDLKTTSSIGDIKSIQNTVVRLGYHWQAAMYLDMFNAATGSNRTTFMFLFVETDYPHETAWVSTSQELIDLGRIGYMNAIARYAECVRNKHFPKAIEGIQEVTAPAWAIQNQ